jgi:hypothetical protein
MEMFPKCPIPYQQGVKKKGPVPRPGWYVENWIPGPGWKLRLDTNFQIDIAMVWFLVLPFPRSGPAFVGLFACPDFGPCPLFHFLSLSWVLSFYRVWEGFITLQYILT